MRKPVIRSSPIVNQGGVVSVKVGTHVMPGYRSSPMPNGHSYDQRSAALRSGFPNGIQLNYAMHLACLGSNYWNNPKMRRRRPLSSQNSQISTKITHFPTFKCRNLGITKFRDITCPGMTPPGTRDKGPHSGTVPAIPGRLAALIFNNTILLFLFLLRRALD